MVRACVMFAVLACMLCSVCSEDGGIAEKLAGGVDAPGNMDKNNGVDRWGWGVYGCTSAYINTTYTDDTGFHTDNKELAKYGECIENDASGVLVHVSRRVGAQGQDVVDNTGCSLPLVPNGAYPNEPWIALIKRGGCNFEVKVQNAFESNATAVIVYDDKQSLNLQKMRLSSLTRNISAVFTYKWKGDSLAGLVDSGIRVYVGIAVGNPCDRPYNLNSSTVSLAAPSLTLVTICSAALAPGTQCLTVTSVLFVSVSFIVLLIISLAWLIFYYVQRFRYIHAKDRLSRRLSSAAKKSLSKIPTKTIKADDKELNGDGECCAICIEPFKIGDILRLLPCKHEFHKSCIDPWLLEQRTCPMCKMDILKYYGFVFTGSQESILHLEVEEGAGDNADSRTTSPIPQILTPEAEEPVRLRVTLEPEVQATSIPQSVEVNDTESVPRSSTKLEFEHEVASLTPESESLPKQEAHEEKK